MADYVKVNPKFAERLARIPVAVVDEARAALAQSAGDITGKMKSRAPKRTGALQDSIVWRFGNEQQVKYSQSFGASRFSSNFKTTSGQGSGNVLSVRISAGNTKVRYSHLVEFGASPHIAGGQFAGAQHPGAPAQPFFFPTWRAEKRPAKRRVARAWRKAIKRSVSA